MSYVIMIFRIINIKYSDKRYEAVDVHRIYYTDFMPFVINQLEMENKSIPFDNWVTKLADKRVKDIKPKVHKSLAKVLLEKGGRENWDYLNDMMYTDFLNIVNNAVYHFFDKKRYSNYYDDVRNTSIEDFKLGGKKRTDLCVSIPLVRGIAEHSSDENFKKELDAYLTSIQYDEKQVYEELVSKCDFAMRR